MAAQERSYPIDLDNLTRKAERVLGSIWRVPIRLAEAAQLSKDQQRNFLIRYRVVDPVAGIPSSVVVKHAQQDGYDSDDPESWPAVGLFRDWAGLQFLRTMDGGERTGSPRFYGGDRRAGFFVMEDLGRSKTLDHVLTCGSRARAERSLLGLAETLGCLHAATAGRESEYQRIRNALGPGDEGRRAGLAAHVRASGPEVAKHCHDLAIPISARFYEDLEHVAMAMEHPGPFLAYTHADPCPDNCLLVGDRACLIDFEFGGFRHALLDGVYGRLRFPTCSCVRDIPAPLLETMESAYRRELAKGCPVASDDKLFFRGVTDACAYWLLENLSHLLGPALEYERPFGLASNRQRLQSRLASFNDVSRRSGHLPALQETFERLLERIAADWKCELSLYDAFYQSAELEPSEVLKFVQVVKAGQAEQVRALLDANSGLARAKAVDPDQTPVLFFAVETKNADLVRALLEHGADWRTRTRSGWTVLSKACSDSTPDIVALLLDYGAELNCRDIWGSLPIYSATSNASMLRLLQSRGAQIDLKTALDLNRLDMAQSLLEEDPARARFRFGTGMTLLHDLAQGRQQNLAAMELLLNAGADIDARTNWGATPLHIAAFNGRARSVEFLRQHGADADVPDDRGQTPLAVAQAGNHQACVAVLLSNRS